MAAILHIEKSAELKISNFSDEDKTKEPCCGGGSWVTLTGGFWMEQSHAQGCFVNTERGERSGH